MKLVEINEVETKGVNQIEWTPELDRQLFRDLDQYVCKTDDLMGMAILCHKYNCTLGAVEKRIEEVHARSLAELDIQWQVFNAHQLPGAGELRDFTRGYYGNPVR